MGSTYPGQILDVYSRSSALDLLDTDEEVIAFDPGDTTGVVAISHLHTYVASYDYKSLLDFLDELSHRLCRGCGITIVCESFITRPMPFARNQIAGKVCGALDLLCHQGWNGPVHYQSPADMKTMLPDLKALRRGGWSWSTDHERDALRHAIYYLVTR